jgi:hypothetical protein
MRARGYKRYEFPANPSLEVSQLLRDEGAVKYFFEIFFEIFPGHHFVFCGKLLMHQNLVAIFCNINQLFGQRVMHTETERERVREREQQFL